MSKTATWDGKRYAMRGAMKFADPLHTPVRGDLAHIRLAGCFFVPHYAVPLVRSIGPGGGPLLAAARIDAELLDQLTPGTMFEVLDISGNWAWGQAAGEDGPVGYVSVALLK